MGEGDKEGQKGEGLVTEEVTHAHGQQGGIECGSGRGMGWAGESSGGKFDNDNKTIIKQ